MKENPRGESLVGRTGPAAASSESAREEQLEVAVVTPPRGNRDAAPVSVKRCGWCGSLNPDRALYCMECGSAIDARAIRTQALSTSHRKAAGIASTSLPLNAVARSVYFAVGAGAGLLVVMWLIMVIPSWLLPPVLAVPALVFIYLASVGRYGSSSLSRYLIMFIWAIILIPVLDLPLIYYVGKGLVAYAALDRSGMIRMARIPSVKWREAVSVAIPIVIILALAVAGVALLRYAGAEMPGNRWEAWSSWIADRWTQVASSDLTERARDLYANAKTWVTGLSIWPR